MNQHLLIAVFSYYLLLICSCSQSSCQGYQGSVSEYMVNYAACSSVLDPWTEELVDWTYGPCAVAQTKDNISDLKLFTNKISNSLVLVLHDKVRNLNIVSFRATMVCNNINEYEDILIIPITFNDWPCSGCQVHQGFYNYYGSLKESTRNHVLFLTTQYPQAKLIITGISLGAAVAAIAAFDLTNYLKSFNHSPSVEAYTYGEPRIGNENYAIQINKIVPVYRVVNQLDPIPHLPPRQWSWYHPGSEVFYDSLTSQPKICVGDNTECSFAAIQKSNFNICDHLSYQSVEFGTECKLITEFSFDFTLQQEETQQKLDDNFITSLFEQIENKSLGLPNCGGGEPKELTCKSGSHSLVQGLTKVASLNTLKDNQARKNRQSEVGAEKKQL